jgi:hypothetical protein
VFGDIVNTSDSESRRLSDAVSRGDPNGRKIGVCNVGLGGRSQCSEPVSSVRSQPNDGLQVAGALADRGDSRLQELSRWPQYSPSRSAAATEGAVLSVRAEHPAWGGRKIARRLKDLDTKGLRRPRQ